MAIDSQSMSEVHRESWNERRLEILAAAARVFRARGLHATRMVDIATEADLSPANLYRYFANKQQIIFICQRQFLETMLAELASVCSQRSSPTHQLDVLVRRHVTTMLGEGGATTAMIEVEVLSAADRKLIINERRRYEQGIRRLVEEGVSSGEFASCAPDLVTRYMLGTINSIVRWFDPRGVESAASIADSVCGFLFQGLLVRPSSEPTTGPRPDPPPARWSRPRR